MPRPRLAQRIASAALIMLVGLAVGLVGLELGLQLLPSVGVSLDRLIESCPHVDATPLNHRPHAGRAHQRLASPEQYGAASGFAYDEDYDERGIKGSTLRPQDGDGVRVLFMGDSFMEGYDDANTIPQRAYEWIDRQTAGARRLILLNAGYSSYSPLIFTVQANRLLPELRPDFLVIDIDETDLYDDAVRYRGLAERDAQGRVVGIGQSPYLIDIAARCASASDRPLMLWRVLGTLYYRRLIARRERDAILSERVFDVSATPESALSPGLRAQAAYFSTTLDELFATLTRYLPADRILVVRHPHLGHLQRDAQGEPRWNRLIGGLVGAAAARHGLTYFDAQDELEGQLAGHPERYYWPGDMHFNFDGLRAYGELVGRELLRQIERAAPLRPPAGG